MANIDNIDIFDIFTDNVVNEFSIDTVKREMKLYVDNYFSRTAGDYVNDPVVVTIWGWDYADYYESINQYFTPVQALDDAISPICDIYYHEWKDNKLTLWGDMENNMYVWLNFHSCHFRLEHVDMSNHINIFQLYVPDSILKREHEEQNIPSVRSLEELLACYIHLLRRPWEYDVNWNNIEEHLYDGIFSKYRVSLFYHEDISQMPVEDLRQYADLINRCNRNNNHCYFIFNEHDYPIIKKRTNDLHKVE
jgi:hypothetical protein